MLRAMVYVPSEDDAGRRLVAESVAKVLATCQAGLCVEAEADRLRDLEAQGFVVDIVEDPNLVKLRSVQIDTAEEGAVGPATRGGPGPAPLSLSAAEEHWIVQFVGPVQPEWASELEAMGCQLLEYVPVNAFLVRMDPAIVPDVQRLEFVNWVGPYRSSYKISPLLMGAKEPATPRTLSDRSLDPQSFQPNPQGNLRVITHRDLDVAPVAAKVKELGGLVISVSPSALRISLPVELVEELARMPEVKWVEPYLPPRLHNNVAADIMAVRPVWEARGLDGEGQIVAVADTGLDTGDPATVSPEFRGRIVSLHSWPVQPGYRALANNTTWDDGPADLDSGHGTHVAGSILGSGALSNGLVKGMAPRARLVFQAVEQYVDWKRTTGYSDGYYLVGLPDDLGQLFQQAYDDGARVHSNSWGDSLHGQYTLETQTIDRFVWEHKDMAILFSAGNDGLDANRDGVVDLDSMASQACAKNCIAVGASESLRESGGFNPGGQCSTYGGCWPINFPVPPLRHDRLSDNPEGMAAFSSRGPADDGRIKPDVVAPGTNILSVRASQARDTGWGLLPPGDPLRPFYMFNGGTSMSTPLVAGALLLLRQYLEMVPGRTPSAALLKALLIHGAVPMKGQYNPPELGPAPDNHQGWGRVNVQNSLFPPPPTHWQAWDEPADAVGAGETRTYTVAVADGSVPLRATLVWSDYPSSPSAGGGLVNRLRLSVVAPDGAVVHSGPAINNVQQAVIPQPRPGQYTLRVAGLSVPSQSMANQKQDFALVVSGGLEFVDLYLRDREEDDGLAPRPTVAMHSPDLWVAATPDPQAPAILSPEAGKPCYVFVRVHNRGPQPVADAEVRLYWTRLTTHPARRLWSAQGIRADGLSRNAQRLAVPARGSAVAVFRWTPPLLRSVQPNFFCLVATVSHPQDLLRQESAEGLRWDNNVVCRSVAGQAVSPGREAVFPFYVSGPDRGSVTAGLRVDARSLPVGSQVRLKVPARYLDGAAATNLREVWASPARVQVRLEMDPTAEAEIAGFSLRGREQGVCRLEITLPATAGANPQRCVVVEQRFGERTVGKLHLYI
ncbi:MAG: S8 family serine peptidase [Anaerolineae bacterium]|nr:S8 family serine peptidase [Anaerolineae bacterium]